LSNISFCVTSPLGSAMQCRQQWLDHPVPLLTLPASEA